MVAAAGASFFEIVEWGFVVAVLPEVVADEVAVECVEVVGEYFEGLSGLYCRYECYGGFNYSGGFASFHFVGFGGCWEQASEAGRLLRQDGADNR